MDKAKPFGTPNVPYAGLGRSLRTSLRCLLMGHLDRLFRLNDGSRMNGDVHVRFCEGLGVKFPGATHPARRGSLNHAYPLDAEFLRRGAPG